MDIALVMRRKSKRVHFTMEERNNLNSNLSNTIRAVHSE